MRFLFVILFLSFAHLLSAQKHLIFLKHETVIARFVEGEYFKCVLKNKKKKQGYILELTEFSMITTAYDTIPFHAIAKVETKKIRSHRVGGVGGFMLIGGLGYIALDQLNSLIGSTKGEFNSSYITALSVSAAGAALLFIKPKYTKVKRGVVMRTVVYRSLYYR
jgi:hypothetical protein